MSEKPQKFMTVQEYVKNYANSEKKEFQPCAVFSKVGDMLIIIFENAEYFAESISPDIEVYRSREDNRIVGCKLWGVRDIVKEQD